MFTKKLLPLFILSSSIFAGCTTSPPQFAAGEPQAAFLERYLDWRLNQEMSNWNVRGLSIAVVSDKELLLQKGYGWQDEGKTKHAAADTIYRVGSLTKLLTATAVMKKAEQGRLDLEAPVSNALAGFKIYYPEPNARPVTIKALLSHHSGLPPNLLKGMFTRQTQPQGSFEDAFKEELAHQHASLPAETQYRYSNLDYAVLGQLLEQKSGEAFPRLLRREILEPLSMTHSHCDTPSSTAPPLGSGYRDGKAVPPYRLRDAAAGCLVSSAADLGRFLQFVLNDGKSASGAVLQAGSMYKMFKPAYAKLPLNFGQEVGIGWLLSGITIPETSESLAWHAGKYPGYFSAMVVSRTHKLGVVILANDENAQKFALEVAADALKAALRGKDGGVSSPDSTAPTAVTNASTMDTKLDPLGQYVIFGNLTEIRGPVSRPSMHLFGRDMRLESTELNRYRVKASLLGFIDYILPKISLEFVEIEQQRFAVLRGMPSPIPFEGVRPAGIPQKWKMRTGQYVATKTDENMAFSPLNLNEDKGILVIEGKAKSEVWGDELTDFKMVLRPISDDLAIVMGLDGLTGGVVRAESRDGVSGLSYSGYFFARQSPRQAGY